MFFFGDKQNKLQRSTGAEPFGERRGAPRRRLNSPVLLGVPDKGIICGDMVDIGTGGLSVIVATQLECGQGCRVCFSIRLGSQKIPVDCLGIVVNSVCVTKGFRIGMRFIITDLREQKVIERFLTEGQGNALVDSASAEKTDAPVYLDAPAVVRFPDKYYPKTVRISDLGRSGG